MSDARMTSSCLLAANAAASPAGPRAATISPGSVPSTTQMHLSPDARPASQERDQDWSRRGGEVPYGARLGGRATPDAPVSYDG